MIYVLRLVAAVVRWLRRFSSERGAEIIYLRQPLMILETHSTGAPRQKATDRLIFVCLYRLFPSLLAINRLQARILCCVAIGHPGPTNCASLALANGHIERPIGSIRRECLDHVVVLSDAHLRQVLIRRLLHCSWTHLALAKDAPLSRPVQRVEWSWPFPTSADFIINTPG